VDREVEHMKARLVELVDHEADDRVPILGYHADTVSLAETAEEIIFGPGVFEAGSLCPHHFRHVPADHPPDVNPR
jgi:hypothetical protein